ncbi:amastin-like protein [Leishmania major strain Friedlin]|uniref:Amastin-like protein n=1 Tax=Leishmania major TaxID=5664 RepID=Q4Q3A8_LEIMA|nr:amastin-like protein [Leishmania major strain Friedlin]CAG9581905.1 amastin-like_protein [Leishmania major strain Friedlin]CAJ07804.1 amastin-like protein [Leishmania major strain Friedlin]|eukprot:XP_001686190.1 amastin-like protein [Leishmania major strain Friedlin]
MSHSFCRVGIAIYCLLQLIAFIFILVGTLIDQFRVQNVDALSNDPCLTIWGFKDKCISLKWSVRTKDLWKGCPQRLQRFNAAEALSIAAVLISALACLIGFVMLCCCRCLRWLCLILNILATFCGCAVTALMTDAFYNNHEEGLQQYNNSCYALRQNGSVIHPSAIADGNPVATHYKYGAGFAIYIVGWGLCFINIFFLMLPC